MSTSNMGGVPAMPNITPSSNFDHLAGQLQDAYLRIQGLEGKVPQALLQKLQSSVATIQSNLLKILSVQDNLSQGTILGYINTLDVVPQQIADLEHQISILTDPSVLQSDANALISAVNAAGKAQGYSFDLNDLISSQLLFPIDALPPDVSTDPTVLTSLNHLNTDLTAYYGGLSQLPDLQTHLASLQAMLAAAAAFASTLSSNEATLIGELFGVTLP